MEWSTLRATHRNFASCLQIHLPNVCVCVHESTICFACFIFFWCQFIHVCCCRSNCTSNDATVKLRQTREKKQRNQCMWARVFFWHLDDGVFYSECFNMLFVESFFRQRAESIGFFFVFCHCCWFLKLSMIQQSMQQNF